MFTATFAQAYIGSMGLDESGSSEEVRNGDWGYNILMQTSTLQSFFALYMRYTMKILLVCLVIQDQGQQECSANHLKT